MLVDDDDNYREHMRLLFQALGIDLITQPSATHAVRFIQNQPWSWTPSLIITDIVMDGMGGYQLIRRIQELYPNKHIPVVVISRLDANIDINEAEVAGAAGYLTKPVEKEQIVEMLNRITEGGKKGMLTFTSDYGRRKKPRLGDSQKNQAIKK